MDFSISAERFLIAIAHHRHDQAALGADRDADMVVVLVDQIGAVDLGIDGGDFLERLHAGAHEEAHEAELHAVLLLEQIAILRAQRHDVAHVDLVEGREHRGGVLCLFQPFGDGLAQPRHAHALFARGVVGGRRRADLNGGGGLCNRRRLRRGAFDGREHVAFGDAAVLAAAGHGRGIDAGFGREFSYRRRERRIRRFRRRRRGRCGGLRRLARAAGAGAAFAAGAAPAPSLIWPSTAPTATVSPSFAAISLSTPAAGAGTSIVTLSVSSSTSGSSTATASPAFLNHLPMVASVTNSPSVGTRISAIMFLSSWPALPASRADVPIEMAARGRP